MPATDLFSLREKTVSWTPVETIPKYGAIARSIANGKGAPRIGNFSPGQLESFVNEPAS